MIAEPLGFPQTPWSPRGHPKRTNLALSDLQKQPLLDSSTMTTKLLAGEYLNVKGSMWSSKNMLQIIRSKALASIAISTTDSDYPSTSNSSPKGKPLSSHSYILVGLVSSNCREKKKLPPASNAVISA